MLSYPLKLSFKLFAIPSRIRMTDATGAVMAYAQQKAFVLKETIQIYSDENKHRELFRIQALKRLDFSGTYAITVPELGHLGGLRRHGMRSLWRASYEIVDVADNAIGTIREEQPWIKVIDGILGAIPLIGGLLRCIVNPAYVVELRGQPALYVKKEPAVFEGKFTVEQRGPYADWEEALLVSSVIMAVLIERARG